MKIVDELRKVFNVRDLKDVTEAQLVDKYDPFWAILCPIFLPGIYTDSREEQEEVQSLINRILSVVSDKVYKDKHPDVKEYLKG